MNLPTRTTIIYGLISAVLVWPSAVLLAVPLGWTTAFKLMLWMSLSGYALFLTHWAKKPIVAPIFPLILILGLALWPGVTGAFFFIAIGALVWIRSGICFNDAPLRALIAETTTIFGGAGLVATLNPHTAVTWSLSIWLFILIQSLYFVMVPLPSTLKGKIPAQDPFDRACRNVQRILDSSC
jgi:hypothetical protein